MKKTAAMFGLVLATVLLLAPADRLRSGEPAEADALLAGFHDPPKEARPATYWLWLNGYVNRQYVERELEAFYNAGIRGVCIFDMGARGDAKGFPPAGPAFMSGESVADIAYAVQTAGRLGMDVQLAASSSWDMGGSWVEPRHGSMGLFHVELAIDGPALYDEVLPMPPIPTKAPRNADGTPAFKKDVAVLAFPAGKRLAGHDFVFRLDPPSLQTLDHAVLYNTPCDEPKKYGQLHQYTNEFSIAVSTTDSADESFREVLHDRLEPSTEPQRFNLPGVKARFVRLRLMSGHNPRSERIQLGEFELFNTDGVNVVASHTADRSRGGAILLSYGSALGQEDDWSAENIHDGVKSGARGSWSSAGPPPVLIEDRQSIINLTEQLQPDGRLKWKVPAGRWAVMRFVCLNTGERLKVPSPNSDGLATDHLSREATRAYLDYVIGRLRSKLGNLGRTALKQIYLASYEVRGPIWTPELPNHFQKYRGYDLVRYLPALSGKIVVNNEITQRFLYDYRKTLGDLLVDAYYRTAVEAAHEAGLGIECEAGGPGPPIHQVPVDALAAQGAIDEIRGEFWPRRPEADGLWVVKETACAGHIYGKRRVHMESFTSTHHWQDGPYDLKPAADRVFCEGANHFVWHTASHLPPEAGKPGWVYHAGTHLNTNVVWWPMAGAFLDYLARGSYLLQQGLFVGDVCYYYGDQGYNFVPPKKVDPKLGFGFDYDVANREVILTRMSVRDGRIVLPDGMSYAILVLPDRQDMDLDVLKKLDELVRDGATVVGPKPVRSGGLTDYPNRDRQVRELADRLWGPCDGKSVLEHVHGKGRIVWGRTLREILKGQGIGPDFSFTSPLNDTQLDFIHRQTGQADIYFVRNKQPRWERVEAVFRVRDRRPELWDADTGRAAALSVFRTTDGGVSVPLQLAPYGSTFVVFRAAKEPAVALALEEPPGSSAAASAEIRGWDGRTASVTIFKAGRYRIAARDGRSAEWRADTMPEPAVMEGPWELQFPSGLGAPAGARFDRLQPWTERAETGIRYFSGIAAYRRDFDLAADWVGNDRRVVLDLGDLWSVARVTVNGRPLGVVWKPPYTVDITAAAVAGRNTLVVEVANTWSNRLVGEALSAVGDRVTRTNVTNSDGVPWKDVPLIKSGLFGPVRLVPARVATVQLK